MEPPVRALGRAERVTGALAIVFTLLSLGGVATAGSSFLEGPTVAAGWSGSGDFGAEAIVPLAHGHSHNDYAQRVPLSDAIERGFTSVEVDVWRIGNRLLVGHEVLDAAADDLTLSALYLDPLKAWVESNEGHVFADPASTFTLVVDVKSGATETYRALDAVLARYSSMLTRFTEDGVEPGAVTVVVSGNRAGATMAGQAERWAAYDGRASELVGGASVPLSLMPMVSAKWTQLFRWNGVGEMPAAERARLEELVDTAHAQGRRVRFYDTPGPTVAARTAVWQAELDAGVDLLNVDNLDAAQRFLLAHEAPAEAPAG